MYRGGEGRPRKPVVYEERGFSADSKEIRSEELTIRDGGTGARCVQKSSCDLVGELAHPSQSQGYGKIRV